MLKKNYEFKNVLNQKKYYGGRYIEIFVIKNKDNKNYLGIAVSKKAANSVNRNKIKRYIREAYYIVEDNIINGYSMVILWKKSVAVGDASFYNIKNDLLFLLKRANLLEMKDDISEENND